MFRSTLILTTLAGASLYAGQIQLSGTSPVNNNVTGFGLTGNATTSGVQYIQGPGPGVTNCAGLQYNGSPCASAIANANTQKGNYVTQLFAGATGLGQAAPDAVGSVSSVGGQLTSNFVGSSGSAIKYDLMNAPNGASGYSGNSVCTFCIDANFWTEFGTTNDLLIPVGLYNVDSVFTMLNDYWGVQGNQSITVTFCFSATSNGACVNTVAVGLTDGVEIRAAVNDTNSFGIATGLAASTSNVSGSGVNVKTGTVFSTTIAGIPSLLPTGSANNSPWAGAGAGSVNLDEQQFIFTSAQYAGLYLASIDLKNTGTGWSSTNNATASRYALSAITIDQAPEPSTVLLVLTGIGVISLGRLRRRRA